MRATKRSAVLTVVPILVHVRGAVVVHDVLQVVLAADEALHDALNVPSGFERTVGGADELDGLALIAEGDVLDEVVVEEALRKRRSVHVCT